MKHHDEYRAYWKGQVSKIAGYLALTMWRDVAPETAATAALERAKAIVRICYEVEDLDELYKEDP